MFTQNILHYLKKFLIIFLSLALFIFGSAGCDKILAFIGNDSSVSDSSSTIIEGEEDWEGNWERPDTPIEDEPVIDRCAQECYVCGNCLNNYEETCSKDICSHEEGRTKYVFNATDDNVKREGGVVIEGDHIGGINLNPNVVITFKINAAEDTVACLGATISRMVEDNFVASETPIYVNGEQYYSRGCSKAGSTVWTDFHTVWLGCIELKAGENELKFTNVSSDGTQYNFKDFTLLSSVELSWVIQECHQCESKNADSYCTDYECNEYACLNKNETGWKQLKIEGGDGRVLKYYINGKGEKQSLWNEKEQVIGNIANSLVTGITDQTVIWAFEATEETYVRVSLNMSVSSGGTAFMEMFDITLNDESIETGGLTGKSNSGNVWTTFVDGTVAYVKVSAGRNVLKFVHKYTNAGDNIKYMTLSYEKGTLTTAPADENMVVVPVTGVTLTAAGDKTSLAVNSSLQLTATVEPENATNKFVSFKSSDDSIAMVNQTGLVTGLKEGNVTITVTTSDGAKTATVDLTVTAMQKPITEGTAYYFEGEEATFTAGIFGGININSNDANARNNTSLGNINCNNNATLTYKVNAAEATKAGLYLNLAFGVQTVENIFTLTVNGEAVTIPTSFTAQGTANWVTYEEYWLANVDLVKGENIIVLTVTGGCGNYDYMKLVSTAEVTVVNA